VLHGERRQKLENPPKMFLAPTFLILDISEGHFCSNLLIMCTLPGEKLFNVEIIRIFFQKKPKRDTFGGIDHMYFCSSFSDYHQCGYAGDGPNDQQF
jgi:hypothetical protein